MWFRDLLVFIILELSSGRVVHFAVTRHPTDVWVAQQLREATPFGEAPRFLIRDNDRKYGTTFDRVASGAGIEVLHTPPDAPRANAYCERFWGSLRRECLDCLFIFGERHLRHCVQEYVHYYHHVRPHQGLAQAIPMPLPPPALPCSDGEIISRPVLHCLHHDYQRRVA